MLDHIPYFTLHPHILFILQMEACAPLPMLSLPPPPQSHLKMTQLKLLGSPARSKSKFQCLVNSNFRSSPLL